MQENDLYRSLRRITGESNGRLRQMGFQHVQVFSNKERTSRYACKQIERRDPPQRRKEVGE